KRQAAWETVPWEQAPLPPRPRTFTSVAEMLAGVPADLRAVARESQVERRKLFDRLRTELPGHKIEVEATYLYASSRPRDTVPFRGKQVVLTERARLHHRGTQFEGAPELPGQAGAAAPERLKFRLSIAEECDFEQRWLERLRQLKAGQRVRLVGTIAQVQNLVFSDGLCRGQLHLVDCAIKP